MEMVCIFSWFNPLVYAYRKSLREVHEFIADAGVISKFKKHKIQAQYALCLVSESSLQQHSETCLNTFHNHLKQRLIMIAKQPSRPNRMLKFAFVLPVFCALFAAFSFRLLDNIGPLAQTAAALEMLENEAISLPKISSETTATPPKPSTKTAEKQEVVKPEIPYILYWGHITSRAVHVKNNVITFEPVLLKNADFIATTLREPRLYNGKEIVQKCAFSIDNQRVSSDVQDKTQYEKSQELLTNTLHNSMENRKFV